MRVRVTTSLIRKGVRGDPARHPVALAILWRCKRQVRVSAIQPYLSDARGSPIDVSLPPLVRVKIRRYDDGHLIKPFGFNIELPPEATSDDEEA